MPRRSPGPRPFLVLVLGLLVAGLASADGPDDPDAGADPADGAPPALAGPASRPAEGLATRAARRNPPGVVDWLS